MTNKTSSNIFSEAVYKKFDVYEYRHAGTILRHDYPMEFQELDELLSGLFINHEDILAAGGGMSPIGHKINSELKGQGWTEKSLTISTTVDGAERVSNTHKVDYLKSRVAAELEWNSKDSVYVRDLNNFRLLHELGVISLGIIITRGSELQKIFDKLGVGHKYGPSTTHVNKLLPRIVNGGAAECPLLVFGITGNAISDSTAKVVQETTKGGK